MIDRNIYIVFLISSLSFFCCFSMNVENKLYSSLSIDKKKDSVFILNETTLKLIEIAINDMKLKKMGFPEKLPLALIHKEKSNVKNHTIHCFDNPVELINQREFIETKGSIIELIEATINSKNELIIDLEYPSKNIWITAQFKKTDNKWEKKKIDVFYACGWD